MKILHKGIISRYAFLFSKLVQKLLRAALVSYNTMPMTRHNLIIGQDRINMWSFADTVCVIKLQINPGITTLQRLLLTN